MFDFSGYATKNDIKCSDGRVIRKDAFKHNNGDKVPLVWQHLRNSPENVLGHAVLEHRDDGVYAKCKFNDSKAGDNAKTLVKHGDIVSLSIHANNLVQKGADVMHGMIREVSLVLSGANPGALIDNITIEHSDGSSYDAEDEAIIYTGVLLEGLDHSDDGGKESSPKKDDKDDSDKKTVGDIIDNMSEEERSVMHYMMNEAIKDSMVKDKEGDKNMDGIKHNLFDSTEDAGKDDKTTLTHAQMDTIFQDAQRLGSLKDSVLTHAQSYGIENIDYLFPEAKTVTPTPEMISRRMEWVSGVLGGVSKTPFSRIKSMAADITADEARAKGYVKGNLKKEEVIKLLRRVTTPTTIYKKQKLDRDDIVDITDFNVVSWLKAEMRVMLDEELARAILIGDGRELDDEDKINEDNIRPISEDDDLYAHKVNVSPNATGNSLIETILRARNNYKGSGQPTLYTTDEILTDLILLKDKMGRRLYPTETELASALRVRNIVAVEPMEEVPNLIGIMVNLNDYKLGADKGGEVSMFDDFDIDYNQHKYLIETRLSGALFKPKSALVFVRAEGTSVTPDEPTFNSSTGVVTIPSQTGVKYSVDGTPATSGAQSAIAKGTTTEVMAEPDEGYFFPHNTMVTWEFTRDAE